MRDQVLVTRPEREAAATGARLRALGFVPVLAPLLTIETLPAEVPAAAAIQAVLVASANAIPGLPAELRATPLFAVGDTTAARAQSAGFERVESAGGDALALARLVMMRCVPAGLPLLIAAGAGHCAELAVDLGARGFATRLAEVYEARPVAQLPEAAEAGLDAGRLHGALFFSAETARVFVRLALLAPARVAACKGVLAVSIGSAATVALEALPWRAVRTAARPTQDEMLKVL